MKTIIKATLAALALTAFKQSVISATGDLDPTFGTDGKVLTNGGEARSMVIQSNGKIVVAGRSSDPFTRIDFAVVRYNSDGSLDTTFNGTGQATTSFTNNDDYGESVAVQSDGKIVLAGRAYDGNRYLFAVVRYNPDGTLDTTFNGTGKITTNVSGGNSYGQSVAVQSDGKIVVAGWSDTPTSNPVFAVVRYNNNGTLDSSFNGGGIVNTDVGPNDDYGYSVAIQSDGKIVVGGYSFSGSSNGFTLVRYNANGSLDTTFNSTGKVTTVVGSEGSIGKSVVIQSDGKIILAGRSNGDIPALALVRYNANGSLDTTFNGTGKVTTPIGDGTGLYQSVALQNNGKIVVGGYTHYGTNYDFAVVRYNADGSLDTPLVAPAK